MSGVLDRMVRRARGELPAVEPLTPSQRTALGARVGFAVEPLEREVTVGDVPRSDRLPVRVFERRTEEERAEAASSRAKPEPALERAKSSGQADTDASQELQAKVMPPRTTAESKLDSEGSSAGDPVKRAALAMSVRQQAEDGAGVPADAAARRFVEVSRAALGSRVEEETSGLRPTAPERLAGADERPAETDRAITREQRQRFAAEIHTAEPAVRAEAPVVESGEHTEIHITIGSIELRAPRTEAKAQPFRPRVTLDEFLRRKPGAGHE